MGFYNFNKPVVGGRFFGRSAALRTINDGFSMGRSYAIGGGSKIGRTSILAQLHQLLREQLITNKKQTRQTPIYIDMVNVPHKIALVTVKYYWEALIRGARSATVDSGGLPPMPENPLLQKRCPEPWKTLREQINQLEKLTVGTSAWSHYVWLIDNADLLFEPVHEEEAVFIRELMTNEISHDHTSVVLAGGRMLKESFTDIDSPFKAARQYNLGLFNEQECRNLCRAGIPQLEPQIIEQLFALTGGHPYALQRLLAVLEMQYPPYNIELAVTQAENDLTNLWQSVWDEIDFGRDLNYSGTYAAPEHLLMQLLIETNSPIELRNAERELGLKPLREVADLFEYLGIVQRGILGDARMVNANVTLWNTWYRQRVRE
ncbi:MAG: hypothetical protein JW841_04225 [Deltaproteobacteria bacterium]|nr:hypothetical protein [Deltaproteobacteria bacterium]